MKLGQQLHQSLKHDLKQKLEMLCCICGEEWSNHNRNCPYSFILSLEKMRVSMGCPSCRDGDVGVNSGDFYECRKCHTQFCSGYKNTDNIVFLDPPTGDLIPVYIMEEKGEGDFPLDRKIKEWYALAEEMIRTLRKENIVRGKLKCG